MNRWVLVFVGGVLGVATISSCGGRSSQADDDDESASGAASGEAGAGTSGSPGQGGGSGGSSGGAPVGGDSSGGISSGGTATGGAAGEAPDPDTFCRLPYATGPCRGYDPSYWFDASTGVCMPFIYGGCEGNDNRFATVEDCYEACRGRGDRDVTTCIDTGECIARRLGEPCCTSDIRDFVAIRRDADFSCDDPALGCQACAADCATVPQDGYFGSRCDAGHCELYDVRDWGGDSCSDEGDCGLHYGADCCVECDREKFPSMLIATDQSFDFPECNITCVKERCDFTGYSAVCSDAFICEVVRDAL